MEKIPHLRERTDRLLHLIADDLLVRLDHKPTDAGLFLDVCLWELGLDKVTTVASKSLEYASAGRA